MITILAAAILSSQPRFQVVQNNGVWWLQSPSGERILSNGVCVVDPGTPFVDYDTANPSYAAWKNYKSPDAWAADAITRLQTWGFNTIGAWSSTNVLRHPDAPGLLFTPILHMGSGAGAPWRDMWDPVVVATMDQIARDLITPLRKESRVVGYFSDNEMGWWEGALFDWAWKSQGARTHLVAVLRRRYGSWARLMRDFEPSGVSSFDGLNRSGRLYLRAGGSGMAAVQDYMGVLAGRYYSLCRSIIKKYDPGALYLGDRYISNFYPEVAEAASPYVDVCSTNLNADWAPSPPGGTSGEEPVHPASSTDWDRGAFAQFYFPTLEHAVKRPILVSEYYMAAMENRSGNKNDSSGFPVAATQGLRAYGFSAEARFFVSHPYVVGAHWFQYYDEPKNGRGDGENYDMGLVDVENRPYAPMSRAAEQLQLHSIHENSLLSMSPSSDLASLKSSQRFGFNLVRVPAGLNALDGVPRLHGSASSLADWDRIRGYVPGDFPRGDLYLAWTADDFYVGLYWNEGRFDEPFYRGGRVPAEDAPRITVRLGGRSYTARAVDGYKPEGFSMVLGASREVRRSAILAFPHSAIGTIGYRQDMEVPVEVTLETRGRAYTGSWKGTFRLQFTE